MLHVASEPMLPIKHGSGRVLQSIPNDAEYDLAKGSVKLGLPKGDCRETNFAYWAGEAPVIVMPLERDSDRANPAIRVEVRINGERNLAILDTGAPRTALTLKAAQRAGIDERNLMPYGRTGGAGEGRVNSWLTHVATYEIGGEKITNSVLRVDNTDMGFGSLLGLDYFLSHRVYVSRLQGKVYITWNGRAVFPQEGMPEDTGGVRHATRPEAIAEDDADGLARRGAAAIAAGDFEHALGDLNRACELAPQEAGYFYARARLHLKMKKPKLAIADLDETLKLDGRLAEARFRRAEVLEAMGDRNGAQEDLKLLDELLAPASGLRADIALMYAEFGQTSEASRQFDSWVTAHEKDARMASVLNGRCWMRTRLNFELEAALQDCKGAVERDPGEPAYHDSMGWTYLRLGDAAKAKKSFQGAIKLKALAYSLYGRALAQLQLNDTDSATADLKAARKLNPQIDEKVRREGFDFTGQLVQSVSPDQ